MLTIDNLDEQFCALFDPVCLNTLNVRAEMMVRLDNKYIIKGNILNDAKKSLASHFDNLEIDHRRVFAYDTCYFDDENLRCFYDHHQGRRQRAKVRIRRYIDTELCFLEAKIKRVRGITYKKRTTYDAHKYGTLDDRAQSYVGKECRHLFDKEYVSTLRRMLDVTYQRITLVSKQGSERITIDGNLNFHKSGKSVCIDDDIFIIETKSANANGVADKILRQYHQHPINKCSKYCLGMCITDQVERFNNFKPALRKLTRYAAIKSNKASGE